MKILIPSLKVILVSILLAFSNAVLADHHISNEERKAHQELKREHKEERREMRRAHRAESMLLRVDTNKDGQVDLNEYLAHAQERFNKLDADANGFVTQDEAKESMKSMREEHRERRKKMREERRKTASSE